MVSLATKNQTTPWTVFVPLLIFHASSGPAPSLQQGTHHQEHHWHCDRPKEAQSQRHLCSWPPTFQILYSTYQHIISHRERSDWLKACNWGLGHSGQKRKGSHHACQVNASTKVKSCEALSENIIYLCLLCGLPS